MTMQKRIVASQRVAAPVAGFPVAVRAGHLLFISGRVGLDAQSGFPLRGYGELGRKPVPALGLLAPDSWEEAFVAQAARMYEDLNVLLEENGASRSDLLFYSIYARAMRNFPVIVRTRAALFAGGVAPPSTASQVPGLLYPDALVYFDPVAMIPDPSRDLGKQVLSSRHVVQGPLSNYELATRAGHHTFYAGVVGAHPQTGVIVRGAGELNDAAWPRPAGGLAERLLLEPISAQTFTIHRLMRDMLAEHGAGPQNVLRHNIYLRDMAHLPEVERIARGFYPERPPAATVIGVESLARSDFLVEIEAITCDGAPLQIAPADPRVACWGHNASAVRGADLVFTSALLGYDPVRRQMIMQPGDLDRSDADIVTKAIAGLPVTSREQLAAAAQTQCILGQLERTLSSLDSHIAKLLKITVYLRDMHEFAFVHRVLQAALGADPPAISVLAAADLPLAQARVQVEAVAL